MKECKCKKCDWQWELGEGLTSWIKCAGCGDSMFDEGIGVILINWQFTDINEFNIGDVLRSNKFNNGVVVKDAETGLKIGTDKVLVNKVEVEPRVSLLEIQYIDEEKGIEAHGHLFANDDGKLDFEGNVTESARVFFEECLKPKCENYIKELHKKETKCDNRIRR